MLHGALQMAPAYALPHRTPQPPPPAPPCPLPCLCSKAKEEGEEEGVTYVCFDTNIWMDHSKGIK